MDSVQPFERLRYGCATAIHLAIFALFAVCSILLCRVAGATERDLLTAGCVVTGMATIASGAVALVRVSFWKRVWEAAPLAPWWGFAAAATTVAVLRSLNSFATPWLSFTFEVCYRVLRVLLPGVTHDPRTFTIGTPAFQAVISEQCSGYEGIVLILVFSLAWLIFFRRELRFPQALLMIPVGMICSWVLNVCRIVVLMLVGNTGAQRVAAGGFHSVAGWIAFILLAISLAVVFQRSPWTSVHPAARRQAEPALNTETAAYLLPFLAILAFRQPGFWAILGSSAVFGLLHGRLWAPGMAAGILYALAARRHERIGDAAAAHGITNALLAAWVVYTGDWHLW